jgi:hypothetical protein
VSIPRGDLGFFLSAAAQIVDQEPIQVEDEQLFTVARTLRLRGLAADEIRAVLLRDYPTTPAFLVSAAVTASVAAASVDAVGGALPSPVSEDSTAPGTSSRNFGNRGFFRSVSLADLEQGKIAIPVDLARHVWIFAAEHQGQRIINLRRDRGLTITVGDSTHASLTGEHLRLLLTLYYLAHAQSMPYRAEYGRRYLEIVTTVGAIHRVLSSGTRHGGTQGHAIRRWLEDLRDTPVRFTPDSGAPSLAPFISDLNEDDIEGKLIIRLHWRWSEAFEVAQSSDGAKLETRGNPKTKPILLREFLALKSNYARVAYVHADWALSHRAETELTAVELLARCGGLGLGERLSLSQQLKRLRHLTQLDGLHLSNGRTLRLRQARAQDPNCRTRPAWKFTFAWDGAASEPTTSHDTLPAEDVLGLVQQRDGESAEDKRMGIDLDLDDDEALIDATERAGLPQEEILGALVPSEPRNEAGTKPKTEDRFAGARSLRDEPIFREAYDRWAKSKQGRRILELYQKRKATGRFLV